MTRPRILSIRLWEEHEQRVLKVFTLALELLRAKNDLDVCEDDLNRRLLLCVRTANYRLNDRDEGLKSPVFYEASNQPAADDEQRAKRESKRPDFQWGFIDPHEEDPLRGDKFYVIECKRLGEPIGKSWVFNKNYVKNGILRFVHAEHGYGKSKSSGAMVGYIRSMTSRDILNEVNGHATRAGLHILKLSQAGWIDKGVSRLDQKLDNREFPPTSFQLRHLWVDFRGI